jgi:predicted SAM-dependent methyltransferase
MKSLRQLLYEYTPQVVRDLIGQFNRIVYKGKDYQCPICLSDLRLFYPLPDYFRINLEINGRIYTVHDFETMSVENYMCPVCRCSDRERLYALYLKMRYEDLKDNKTLVHFAPEKSLSRYLKQIKKRNYRTADLHMKDVDDRLDITDMNIYETDSVNCFICSHVLEHVPDDKKALQELFRILKPSGWGILMVPLIPELDETYEDFTKTTGKERLKHFGQEDHVRVYAKKDFIKKMENAGFIIHQIGRDYFGKDVFNRCGISEKSFLYIVEKGRLTTS